MTWATLRAARLATETEFTEGAAARHHFVRLPNGRWCRTYGPPGNRDVITGEPRPIRHIRGRTWRLEPRK